MVDFFGGPFRRPLYARPLAHSWPLSATAAMDWVETLTSHVLKINVPGLGNDDVKIQVEDGNVLSVRGFLPPAVKERKEDDKDEVWHVAERGNSEFTREVVLPEHVRVDQISASVDNGVLIVVMPKEPAPALPRTRPIAVSSKL